MAFEIMEPQYPATKTKNIIVFGDKGVGKSSLIKLLTNNSDPDGPPIGDNFYPGLQFQTTTYNDHKFYEVVAINDTVVGVSWAGTIISNIFVLISSLEQDGVVLLIHVITRGRITTNMENNYNLFVRNIFLSSIPVMVLISHCESESKAGTWWKSYEKDFALKYGMKYDYTLSACLVSGQQSEDVHPTFKALMDEFYAITKDKVGGFLNLAMLEEPWDLQSWWNWTSSVVWSSFNVVGYLNPLPNFGIVDSIWPAGSRFVYKEAEDFVIVEKEDEEFLNSRN